MPSKMEQLLATLHCDRLSQWKMANFDPPPYRIETPEPIDIKFGTRDYHALCQIWCESVSGRLLGKLNPLFMHPKGQKSGMKFFG